jgi:hypothetical protein
MVLHRLHASMTMSTSESENEYLMMHCELIGH